MRIAIGSDHGGFELKEHLKRWLGERGHEVEDCGTYDPSPTDYPVVAAAVARKVSKGECRRGIVIDGAGIGSSIAANKLRGVRAALCYDVSSAKNAREHNDANVLTLGARMIGVGLAEQIAAVFLDTECTEARHKRRVAMIGEIEREPASACASGACATGACASGATPCGPCAAAAAEAPRSPEQKTLAHEAASKDGAARSPDDGAAVAFRASAAQWLAARPAAPTRQPQPSQQSQVVEQMKSIEALSPADLERVAARLAELIGGGVARGDKICFGDVCIDARLARQWIDFGVGRLSTSLGGADGLRDVAAYIDHTLLKPDATEEQVRQLCAEARKHSFKSVCVNPYWVKLCAELLRGSPVLVCTVVGFPLGANVADLKAMETRRAIRDGAREIDMVINIGALKSGDDETVFRDIRAVVDACEDGRALSKVIIETALLTDEEKVRACVLSKRARADFVKTSTGFASGGATAADVALMHKAVGGTLGVKASGGVRSLADFEDMVRAGATRIGASAGIRILKEAAS